MGITATIAGGLTSLGVGTATAGIIATGLVGAATGAAIGGGLAAVTGGDIGQGALFGGLSGGALSGVGALADNLLTDAAGNALTGAGAAGGSIADNSLESIVGNGVTSSGDTVGATTGLGAAGSAGASLGMDAAGNTLFGGAGLLGSGITGSELSTGLGLANGANGLLNTLGGPSTGPNGDLSSIVGNGDVGATVGSPTGGDSSAISSGTNLANGSLGNTTSIGNAVTPGLNGLISGAGSAVANAAAGAGSSASNALSNLGTNALIGSGINAATGLASNYLASQAQVDAANRATALQENIYNTTVANEAPYMQLGNKAASSLGTLTGTGTSNPLSSPLLQAPTSNLSEAALQNTPGYQFNLTQGLKATQNAAAARGLGTSGAALKGAATYATGLADQTYQNQFNNAVTNQTNQYNRLTGLANSGQSAAANQGSIGTQTGSNIASNITGAGNAQAGGYLGGANAIGNGVNNYLNYGLTNALLQGAQQNSVNA